MSTQLSPVPGSNVAPFFGKPFAGFGVPRESAGELRASWYWFAIVGAALFFLGLTAMTYSVIGTFVTAIVLGFFLVGAGFFHFVGAFFTRAWGGFFLGLLAGILNLAVGAIVLDRPGEAVLIYTLLLAAYFFVEGLFRIVGALAGQFQYWGWMLFNGIVTAALGVMIWREWPLSGLYVIGLFLGINLVISGISYISLGLSVRRLPV
jgi:uncharacterized membrane protein HdeD (DUF308 family)